MTSRISNNMFSPEVSMLAMESELKRMENDGEMLMYNREIELGGETLSPNTPIFVRERHPDGSVTVFAWKITAVPDRTVKVEETWEEELV